jgi:poly(A) polymerase
VSAKLDPADHPWMRDDRTRAVMSALKRNEGEARFVGGAVRNALLGVAVSDIDIATPLTPDEVVKRLKAGGLTAVPTGIAHGTITAVASGKPFEVTTLRRDVSTDGRRATVAFTKDWAEDAARRDFTMNALYAGEDGTVFDMVGGVEDLRHGRVRFVGDPRTRIREDYLRILRLFRFFAWYGKGPLDAEAMQAVVAEKHGLQRLSGERVQKELLRLLEAEDPIPALHAMDADLILNEVLPAPVQVARLHSLLTLARASRIQVQPVLRLAALLGNDAAALDAARRLRLSNADRDRLVAALGDASGLNATMTVKDARKLRYRLGDETFRDRILVRWAEASDEPRWSELYGDTEAWQRPEFPLDGGDAIAAGVAEGPAVGRVLRALETWWIEHDFAPGRDTLQLKMKELLAQPES